MSRLSVDKHASDVDNTPSVTLVCRLAMVSSEPGQARKGAAVVVTPCAGIGWRESHLLAEIFASTMNRVKKSKIPPLCVRKLANNWLTLFMWWFAEGKKPQNKKRISRIIDCVSCLKRPYCLLLPIDPDLCKNL